MKSGFRRTVLTIFLTLRFGIAAQTYGAPATSVVRKELHKAGWRLAGLLEKAL